MASEYNFIGGFWIPIYRDTLFENKRSNALIAMENVLDRTRTVHTPLGGWDRLLSTPAIATGVKIHHSFAG